MQKLAIDIVLLPDKAMTELAINYNKILCVENDGIKLGLADRLPHISLFMGVVKEEDISKIVKNSSAIAEQYKNISLVATELTLEPNTDSYDVSHIKIEASHALQELQQQLITKLKLWYSHKAEASHFTEDVGARSVSWVQNYLTAAAGNNFDPHITLGLGAIPIDMVKHEFPIEFKANSLAICQLGNFCTCHKIIRKFLL